MVNATDYSFLDDIAKTDEEKRGSAGKFKGNRRKSRKVFCDIKFVCTYIETKAEEEGMDIKDRGQTNVRLMYEKVSPALYECVSKSQRGTQLKWRTLASRLRAVVKKLKEAENT